MILSSELFLSLIKCVLRLNILGAVKQIVIIFLLPRLFYYVYLFK